MVARRIAVGGGSLLLVAAAVAGAFWLGQVSEGTAQPEPGHPAMPAGTGRPPAATSEFPHTGGAAGIAQPAPSQIDAERPQSVRLPSGTTVPVDAAGTGPDGELVIPTDIDRAGWWDGSSRLGDPFGSIVVAAHIDSFSQGLGRFVELLDMRVGDRVTVSSASLSQEFVVVSARLVPKSELSAGSSIYSAGGESRLVLITCGGSYDASSGGYQDNMVVEAVPSGPPRER